MIDFATPVRKNRLSDPQNSDEFKIADLRVSNNHASTNSNIPDLARTMVSTNPAVSVAVAFAVGGIIGWLTSRR